MTTFLSETVCGRWMSDTVISLNIWLMKDQSFGISDELCTWLMANTPGWHFGDDTSWPRDTWRRLTFAKAEDAVLFRMFWEDESKAPKWFLDNPY